MNSLSVRCKLLSGLIALCFWGGGAAYAQPTTEDLKIVAGDGLAGDLFGGAVAAEGDRVVVGAYGDDGQRGSAYIYEFDGTTWNQTTKLIAGDRNDPQQFPEDQFGSAVSLLGNRLLVGAKADDDQRPNGSEINVGSMYAFEYDGAAWTQVGPRIRATLTAPGSAFGNAISQSGDRALVGAPGRVTTAGMNGHGGAFIFEHNGSAWVEAAALEASDKALQDRFGTSVSLEGDRAVVGSFRDDHAGGADAGSAYVFEYNGSAWIEVAKLTASDAAAGANFGTAVALSGDRLFVGAQSADAATGPGSVYVFEYDGATWVEVDKLMASDGVADARFGGKLSTTGDRLLVGADFDDDQGATSGSAYLFEFDGANWNEEKLTASDLAAGDRFGFSVFLSDDRAFVGSVKDDDNGTDSGSAYVFDLATDVEVSVPTVTATYNQALTIPVSISDATGIVAGEVTLEYDTDLLTLNNVSSAGTLSDGWSVESNTQAGAGTLEQLKIALATDVNVVTGPATWINVNFTVNDVRLPATSALTLSGVLLNAGDPTHVTVDGLVTLVGTDGTMSSDPVQFIPREDLTATVVDADADVTSGPGNDNVSVSVTNLNNGDAINATLAEDATTAGTFSLVVPTEFGLAALADATIQAQAADVIEFTFVDALDSNGNGPTNRTDQSTAIGGTDGTAAITQVTQPGDVIYLKVVDADLNTDDQTAETAQIVVTSSNGESETVTLTEVDLDDDVFFGSLNSVSGAAAGPNDGILNAAKGDVLTATYDDVVTALGDQLDRVDTNQGIVDPFGDADGNGLIQAFDAAQVLQHILVPPLVTLTGLELLAADVADNFGEITPFDAAFILQKVVGLITTFPVQEATSLNHPQAVPSSSPKKAVETRGLVLAYVDGYLSVKADERADILSGDVLLTGVDGQVQLGAELDDFIVASRQTEDGLRILFAGAVPADGPGELLRVYSGVGPNKPQLSRARFNDGAIVAGTTQTTGIAARPAGFALHANWPNPFNPETTIAFDLPQAGSVELQVFDVLGQSVRTLVAESLPAGSHQVVWNGLDASGARVSSGVYVYRLQAGQQVRLRRMLLLK